MRLPKIEIRGKQLRELTADALHALNASNRPHRIFRHGRSLVVLSVDDATNVVCLTALIDKHLRHELARAANWFKNGKPTAPPTNIVKDIEATHNLPSFPILDCVVTCPVAVSPDRIVFRQGFDSASGLWYQPARDLVLPPVPARPSAEQIRQARDFIDGNLFIDFPFVAPCDVAVAWAYLVLPFVRLIIYGPTPMCLITAPTEGTGKTLLAHCLSAPALGDRDVGCLTIDCGESEMRKRITAKLRESAAVLLFDNLGQRLRLESSSLAAVLIANVWSDRLLGQSAMASLPVRCVWLATANNPTLSAEMVRRTVRCRLDSGQARPYLRSGFKHANILTWARANRPSLVGSILTLAQAWIQEGMPYGKLQLGMFESWCQVVGGVLQVAGVEGLDEAIRLFQGAETDHERTVGQLIQRWWQQYGAERVGVKHLFELAKNARCLDALLELNLSAEERRRGRGKQSLRSQQTNLGIALRRICGHVFSGFRITADGSDNSSRMTYRLSRVSDVS